MRGNNYGKLQLLQQSSEVRHIWATKHNELKPTPRLGWMDDFVEDLSGRLEDVDWMRKLLKSTDNLTKAESVVLAYRFDFEMTLEECGDKLGVTRERIRQIEAKALRKLRTVAYRLQRNEQASLESRTHNGLYTVWDERGIAWYKGTQTECLVYVAKNNDVPYQHGKLTIIRNGLPPHDSQELT